MLCAFLTVVMLGSMAGVVCMAEMGAYDSDSSTLQNLNEKAGEAYATWAFANYYGGELYSNCDTNLNNIDFSYGIIEGDVKASEITADTKYVDRNFTGNVPKEARTAVFHVGSHPSYCLSERLLGENNYSTGIESTTQNINVQGIGFDMIGQQVYVWDGTTFYLVYDEFAYPVEEDYYEDYNDDTVNAAYAKLWKNHEPQKDEETITTEAEQLLYMGKRGFPSMKEAGWNRVLYLSSWQEEGGLQPEYVADLSGIHDELVELSTKEAKLTKLTTAQVEVSDANMQKYTVVYFAPNQPDMIGGWVDGNMYTQAAILNQWIQVLVVVCPILMVVGFVGALVLFVLLMCAAGHRYGEDGIHAGFLERVPMDLMLVAVCCMELLLFLPFESLLSFVFRGDHLLLSISAAAIIVFIGAVIGIRWLMTIATNVKLGHWWHNTLIARFFHFLGAAWSRFLYDTKVIRKAIRWQNRIWAVFGIFVFLELFGLALFQAEGGLLAAWVFEKVLFGVGLHLVLKHYAKLKESALKMAAGDMAIAIDTKGMPLDFEEHAEALNTIKDGMATAVAERMKSERMKTELITNVSHDIKTPLTSIINYVDLLEKEQIEDEKAKEYLEVLDRQSKRLKKLIEDLIEASKAATGNIKFEMERVNARMILNQSIGEFAERLEQNQIALVSNIPEEDLYVWADNRYLWRVFDNLMNNIAKYAQPGTRAYIDLKKHDGKVEFTFRNTSKNELNISADELMERFVRGDASRNTEGNGLGLSIARSLTESMDGSMNLAIDCDLFKVILEFQKQ